MVEDLGPVVVFCVAAVCFWGAAAGLLSGRMLNIVSPGVLFASREHEPWSYWLSIVLVAFGGFSSVYHAVQLIIA